MTTLLYLLILAYAASCILPSVIFPSRTAQSAAGKLEPRHTGFASALLIAMLSFVFGYPLSLAIWYDLFGEYGDTLDPRFLVLYCLAAMTVIWTSVGVALLSGARGKNRSTSPSGTAPSSLRLPGVVKWVVAGIGFVSSVLGIVAFYLEHMRAR